jgi:hypothetical protein
MSACEQAIHLAFYAKIENNQRQIPENDDMVLVAHCTPSDTWLLCVQDTGEDLVRTINYRLNENQVNALLFWLNEHPEDRYQPQE